MTSFLVAFQVDATLYLHPRRSLEIFELGPVFPDNPNCGLFLVFLFRSTSTMKTFASYLFRHSQTEISPICQITTCITGIKLLHLLVPLTHRHNHCPSNLIFTDLGYCPWLEEFAWFRHNSWWPSCSTSLFVIYPSHSFYFRATSYALKGIVIWSTSALQKCPRCLRSLPSQNWSTVVGRHQNWISSHAVRKVIFSRLHAQSTRFLSLVYFFDLSSLFKYLCALDVYPATPLWRGQ